MRSSLATIDQIFDGGNIEVVDSKNLDYIQLRIRHDLASDYAQWFYFRVIGQPGVAHHFRIMNAHQVTYPEAWPGGSIVYSEDRAFWMRRRTDFDGKNLLFDVTPKVPVFYVALSPPYSLEQHQNLIARAQSSPFCQLHRAARSVQGRPVEMLSIGTNDPDAPRIWITARQHPGEPMASWYIEGLLDRLLDASDQTAAHLRNTCRFFVVPNMNPDGSFAGNLRTNAAGVDLNRAWAAPSSTASPEVFAVLAEMKKTGVDMYLDIHGDEEIEMVFAAGCEGNPGFSNRHAENDARFRALYQKANPDFRVENGYPPDEPGQANLAIGCNQVGELFDCLSLTIELPFKDNAYQPDQIEGWSTYRSKALGAAGLTAISEFFFDL